MHAAGWKADDWDEFPDSDKEEWGDELGGIGGQAKAEDVGGDEDGKDEVDGDAADGE